MAKNMIAISLFVIFVFFSQSPVLSAPQIIAKAEVMDPTTGRYSMEAVTISASCPVTVKFGGRITARAPGKVEYRWVRSDGRTSPAATIKLEARGSQRVEYSWTIESDYAGWVLIEIMSPGPQKSNQAEFKVSCLTPSMPAKKLAVPVSKKEPEQKTLTAKITREAHPVRKACRFYIAGDSSGIVDIFDASGRKVKSFDGNYTVNDGFALGDVNGDGTDEICIAGDSSGRIDIFDQDGNALGSFDGDYTANDGFALGDVNGDGKDEILVAGDSSGVVDIFSWTGERGNKIRSFNARYTIHDAFGTGDINGDGRDEILIYGETRCFVDIFNFEGGKTSFRTDFTPPDEQHIPYTAIGAGDVNGDGTCNIVVAFNVGERHDRGVPAYFGQTGVRVYTPSGTKLEQFSGYTQKDGFSLGDYNGDGVIEIIIAGDSTRSVEVFNSKGEQLFSFIGNFTQNDGFAASRHH